MQCIRRLRKFTKFDWFVGIPTGLLFSALCGLLLMDLSPPLYNVKVEAYKNTTVKAGGILKLVWHYNRFFPARVVGVKRTITCDGSGTYEVFPVNEGDNLTSWPSGLNSTASILIALPDDLPVGICWYSGYVTYKRNVLSDLTIQQPPIAVKFKVTN